jgi:hypothetical protein
MTEDAIAALERDVDQRLGERSPQDFARMIAARERHDGEPGYAPPPKQEPKLETRYVEAVSPVRERVLHVGAPLSGRQIEAMTGALIADVYDRATRTLMLADEYARAGQSVDIYTVVSSQAVRLIMAYAALVEALQRFKSGGAQKIVVERCERRRGCAKKRRAEAPCQPEDRIGRQARPVALRKATCAPSVTV